MIVPIRPKAIEVGKRFLKLPHLCTFNHFRFWKHRMCRGSLLHICLNIGKPIKLSFSNLGRSPTGPSSTFCPSRSNTSSNCLHFSTISTSKFCKFWSKLGGSTFNSEAQFFIFRDRRLQKESRSWPCQPSCNMRNSESKRTMVYFIICICQTTEDKA